MFYLFLREREREGKSERASRGGAERERETQNPKQDPGSEPSAQSPTRGLFSQTMRSHNLRSQKPEPKLDA